MRDDQDQNHGCASERCLLDDQTTEGRQARGRLAGLVGALFLALIGGLNGVAVWRCKVQPQEIWSLVPTVADVTSKL